MANLDLYIDTVGCQAVAGFTSPTSQQLPLLVQGDTLNMRIWLLSRTATYPIEPFSYVSNTGLTLQVAIGTRKGTGGVLYTQQFTWTANPDQANPYFSAQLPMNTAGISNILGVTDNATAYLEVKYISGGVPTTVLSTQVTLLAAVIQNNSLVTPAVPTPLSAEAAQATFLQHDITGPIILRNTTGQAIQIYVGSDGAFHTDPIS